MKVQVINTDFLHDGKYYSQNSIINVSPDLIKKYPSNLLLVPFAEAVIEPVEKKVPNLDENVSSEMIQENSTANNMLAPYAELVPSAKIVKPKSAKGSAGGGTKKNKRGKKC